MIGQFPVAWLSLPNLRGVMAAIRRARLKKPAGEADIPGAVQ